MEPEAEEATTTVVAAVLRHRHRPASCCPNGVSLRCRSIIFFYHDSLRGMDHFFLLRLRRAFRQISLLRVNQGKGQGQVTRCMGINQSIGMNGKGKGLRITGQSPDQMARRTGCTYVDKLNQWNKQK